MSGYANLIGKIWINQIFISVTPAEVMLKLNDRLLRQRVRTQLRNQALSEKDSKIDKNLVESYTDEQIKTKFHRLLAERTLLREQDEFDIPTSVNTPEDRYVNAVRSSVPEIEYVAWNNDPIYVRFIEEGDYEYAWHHDEPSQEGRSGSTTDYSVFPADALKIAITKSPRSSSTSRENPRYVPTDNAGYDTIKDLILRWNEAIREEYDVEQEESEREERAASQQAQADALRERIDLVNSQKTAAEELGREMADSLLYETLTQTKKDYGGNTIGWVYDEADPAWVLRTLEATWRAAEDLFPTLAAGTHGDLVLDSRSPGGGRYMWNAFTRRVNGKMGRSPYTSGGSNWGFSYDYYEVVEWSYNNITDYMMGTGDAMVSDNETMWRAAETKALNIKRKLDRFMANTSLPGKSSAWTDFGVFSDSSMAQPWDD
jgi:hypothetical protein